MRPSARLWRKSSASAPRESLRACCFRSPLEREKHASQRQLEMPCGADPADARRLADNYEYFGPPVYEYPYLQGVEDGYFAPPEIGQYDLYHERQTQPERVRGEGLLPAHLQSHRGMAGYDLYDVLASAAYGVPPRTRAQRAAAFHAPAEAPPWLVQLPQPAAKVIRAIVRQFEKGGTEALDSRELFHAPEVKAARGLTALKQAGDAQELLRRTKEALFIA
jgi:hypothetical protein